MQVFPNWRPGLSLRWAAFGLAALSVASAQQPAEPSPEATRDAVTAMLSTVWNAPGNVTDAGRVTLTRARKDRADRFVVDYAYALALLNANQAATAETLLRKMLTQNSGSVPVRLMLVIAYLAQDNYNGALGELERAVEADRQYPPTVALTAALVTFFVEQTPEKFPIARLRRLGDAVLANLSPDGLALFRQVQAEGKEYLAQLAQRRQELLAAYEGVRQQLADVSRQLAPLQQQRDSVAAQANALQVQRQALLNNFAVVDTNYVLAIRRAEEFGDFDEAARLRNLRALELSRLQVQVSGIEASLNAAISQLQLLDSQLTGLAGRANQLRQQLASAEAEVDRQLRRPPLPFGPATERDRLLALYSPAGDPSQYPSPLGDPATGFQPGANGQPASAAPPPPAGVPGPGVGADGKPMVPPNPAAPAPPAAPNPTTPTPPAPPPTGPAQPPTNAPADPADEQRAQSLLRLAASLEAIGKIDKAREYLERIRADFPATKAAAEAATGLQRLAAKPAAET